MKRTITVDLRWFHYSQNNSGGVFRRPALEVFIEAPDLKSANAIAEDNGVYFDGVRSGDDCSCCGDRWSEPWCEDGHDGDLEDWEEYKQYTTNPYGRGREIPEQMIVRYGQPAEFKDGQS